MIGGSFTSYNGTSRNRIARLNTDGNLDSSFNPGTGVTGTNVGISSITLQSDGKILIVGSFTAYNGTPKNRLARLNTDGSIETSFNPVTGANSNVSSIALQLDGKIIIGGSFTAYNGTDRNSIARLNTDGSLDTNFNPRIGIGGSLGGNSSFLYSIALQSDGKILIGGGFSTYSAITRNGIARLNIDGSLDNSFNPGIGANDYVSSIALQSDGKILMGGSFTTYNGTPRNRIARLNANGSLDNSFNPGTGVAGANFSKVYSIVLQQDGKS